MTSRIEIAVGVIAVLIVFPFLVVQAQSEGETQGATDQAAAEQAIVQQEAAATTTATTTTQGEVLGQSDGLVQEPAVPAEAGTTTASTGLPLDTASSSPPEDTSLPIVYAEPFVLQPAVQFTINGNALSADIALENLTCKSCEKVLPDLDVVAYYTAWYPNDGEIKEVGEHFAEQTITVANVANWAKRDMSWSAEAAPGHYYLVVVVDPDNKNEAYRLYRAEFSI